MSHPSKYVDVREAVQRTGLTRRTFDRRLASGEVPVYRSPQDRRRRLIAVEDLPKLTAIEQITRRESGSRVA